jgi:hypothetical protein
MQLPPNRSPSPDKKYPFIGPNYHKHGEVPGFIYDPYSDTYRKPRTEDEIRQAQGKGPKEEPGLGDLLVPVAAGGLALAGGQALGKEIPGVVKEGLGGMLGTGGPSTSTTATGAFGADAAAPYGAIANPATGEAVGTMGLPTGGMFGLSPTATGVAGGLGLGAGLYGLSEAYKDKDPVMGAFSGAGAGLGGGMLATALGASAVPGPGWLLGGGALLGAGVGMLGGLFDKPSTRELVKERWIDLAKQSDPATQTFANQYLQYLDSDQAKEDAKIDFGELKKAGSLTPEQVWGGHGMFKTFGSDWLGTYTPDQRRQISQGLIDAGLLDSKKGDIVVNDAARAKQIRDQVLGIAPPPQPVPAQGILPPQQAMNNDVMLDPTQATGQVGQIAQGVGMLSGMSKPKVWNLKRR